MSINQKILILGAGSFARSIADIIEEVPGNQVIGFVVNLPPFTGGSKLADRPIYWVDEIEDFDKSILAVCALGRKIKKKLIDQVASFGFDFTTFIHPTAYVSKTAKIGKGVIINSGVQLATNVVIGDHVVINRGALIGHDSTIQDYCMISPGVNIASFVNIGPSCEIKMSASIIEHITIGEGSFIGASSLVTGDVPADVKVVGIPAQVIERNIKD